MEDAHIYKFDDYKEALKFQTELLRKKRSGLTLKKLASQIPVQYTFLSKVLNVDNAHLGEEHLFKLGQLLELLPDETDYLLLLRARQVANTQQRREYLHRKIEKIRSQRNISADFRDSPSERLNQEMTYLFNPLAMVVHVALFIKEYRAEPQKLIGLLGITTDHFREILLVLEKNEYIVTGEDIFEIKEVKQKFPHFGPEHPLMRLHQHAIKSHLLQKMTTVKESDRDSFVVTFTTDSEGFRQIKELFRKFLNQVQKVTFDNKNKNVYQLNFDLLKWF